MMLMVIGCSHHKSSIDFRERISFSADQVRDFSESLYASFPNCELAILSTCNRTEFYVLGSKNESLPDEDEFLNRLVGFRGLDLSETKSQVFRCHDEKAVRHLFTVSSSLDSMVVGETQILSQVKQAYELATSLKQSTPLTHLLFDNALRVAKRVSTDTDIHSNRVSVPSIAVNVLAKQIFERLDNKRILVLGAGEMAEETLNYLVGHGAKKITVCNRSIDRAKSLAERFDGSISPWTDLVQQISIADMVISTTASTEPIMTCDTFGPVVEFRKQKPLFILDLSVPRDFEDEIGNELNVYLYSLDDLQVECERNLKSRKSEWPKAISIVEEETGRFLGDVRRRAGGSTIAQLKRQANSVKDEELKRLLNRLESASDADKSQIEQSFHRLVNKLLHPPLESIREDSAKDSTENQPVGLVEAMKRLFQLKD